MKIADAHLHLFRHGFPGRYGAPFARANELELYNALRREHGIVRGLIVGYEGRPAYQGNNRDLAVWRRAQPWMAPLAYCGTAAPPAAARLEAFRKKKFAGLALYVFSQQDVRLLLKWPARTTEWLGRARSIVSLNTHPPALAKVRPFLERLAGCAVLISHLGLPGACAAPPTRAEARAKLAALRRTAALPWVGVKLSGLYALSRPAHDYPQRSAYPFIRQALDDFGPRRLYWGSDYSPALAHLSFAQCVAALNRAPVPARDLPGIMGGNLLRVLRHTETA